MLGSRVRSQASNKEMRKRVPFHFQPVPHGAEQEVADEHLERLTLVQELRVDPVLFILVHAEEEEHAVSKMGISYCCVHTGRLTGKCYVQVSFFLNTKITSICLTTCIH